MGVSPTSISPCVAITNWKEIFGSFARDCLFWRTRAPPTCTDSNSRELRSMGGRRRKTGSSTPRSSLSKPNLKRPSTLLSLLCRLP